jgi:hypothetical protein
VSNHESIYPTFADEHYDPSVNTVASCARNVPLLWFGMFHPSDLVTRAFETDDGPYVVVAPVTTCDAAIEHLAAATERLNELFAGHGRLDGYIDLLSGAVRHGAGGYVTIEWDEIDVITAGDFLVDATAAMASLEPSTVGDPDVDRARLLRLAGIDPGEWCPPGLVGRPADPPLTEAEWSLRGRIIGTGRW